jgi:hypothetical protein
MHYSVQAISFEKLHNLGSIELGTSDPSWQIAQDLVAFEFLLDGNVYINLSRRRKTIVVSTDGGDDPILLLRREDVQVQ